MLLPVNLLTRIEKKQNQNHENEPQTIQLAAMLRGSWLGVQSASLIMTSLMTS